MDHPFCPQCNLEQEDKIREKYAIIETEISAKVKADGLPVEELEIATEICRLECEAKLAFHHSKHNMLKTDSDVESQNSQHDSSSAEINIYEGTDADINHIVGGTQKRQAQKDDLESIVDAYSGDDGDDESVTDSIPGIY